MTSPGFECLAFIKCTRDFSKLREWWPTGPYKPFMLPKYLRMNFDFCTEGYALWLRMGISLDKVGTIFLTYGNYSYCKTDLDKKQLINRFLFCRQQAEHDLLRVLSDPRVFQNCLSLHWETPSQLPKAKTELCWLMTCIIARDPS